MKRGPSLFLRAVLVLIGIGALAFLLWEPHIEGRNTHATLFEIWRMRISAPFHSLWVSIMHSKCWGTPGEIRSSHHRS
jgi:hypothetical protein